MSEQAYQATRAELAQGARDHYEAISMEVCSHLSTIPKAIDAWEKQPQLEAENQRLRELIMYIIDSVPGGVLDEAPHQEIIDSIYEEKKLLED